jgi:Alternative complex III, ActD subunit
MAGKNTAVFGVYSSEPSMENAVEALRVSGFRNSDISVLVPRNSGSKDLGTIKTTKAPEGAAAGAASGAIIGGALGWLVAAGMLTIPGLGPFLAAGPIVGALAGAGAAGTVGGVGGALVGWGIPEFEAKRYEGRIRRGSILLSVHCDDLQWTKQAKEILERTGAEDVSATGEAPADYASSDKPMPRAATGA